MHYIKFIALIISLLALLCSCKDLSLRKARTQKVYYSAISAKYEILDSTVEVVLVDTMHKVGDIIDDKIGHRIIVK